MPESALYKADEVEASENVTGRVDPENGADDQFAFRDKHGIQYI